MLILEFLERNMHRLLDYVHNVEALNKPVDDSGSEGAKLFVNTENTFCVDFFGKFSLFFKKNFYMLLQE